MVFRIGVSVLIVGVVLFGYGTVTVLSLFEQMRELYANLVETAVETGMGPSPIQIVEQQLFLMQFLQLIGLGMAVVGAIMLVYGLGVKKEMRPQELP